MSLLLAGLAAGGAAAIAHGIYEPNSPLFGRSIGHGHEPGAVHLTFDDGPNPVVTPRLLDVLAERSVRAAFFVVGEYARREPALVRRMADEGHLVGNHTWSHVKLHRVGPARVRDELRRTHDFLADLLGAAPRWFRAPHGYRTPFVTAMTRELGYATAGWSFGVWDSANPGAEVIRARVRRKVRSGSIVLLHDGDGYAWPGDRAQTLHAVPGILADAEEAGLRWTPLAA